MALDVAQYDPINRHDLIAVVSRRLVRSNLLRMTPRFRESELGTMSLEESGVGAQTVLVRLTQHRPGKRRIVCMLQKVRPAKLIIAAHQLKRNQVSIKQRVQIAAQQDSVADNLRLGARIILDMRGFERLVNVTARDGASTGISLKELSAEPLPTNSLAT